MVSTKIYKTKGETYWVCLTSEVGSIADMPKLNTTIIWTLVFEWHVIRCASKNPHQNIIFLIDIGLHVRNMLTILGSTINMIVGPIQWARCESMCEALIKLVIVIQMDFKHSKTMNIKSWTCTGRGACKLLHIVHGVKVNRFQLVQGFKQSW